MVALRILCLLSLLLCAQGQKYHTCPFQEACTCQTDNSGASDYVDVQCSSVDLPAFSDRTGTFTAQTVQISSQATYKLPANYFASFTKIQSLTLVQDNAPAPVPQQFDANAFQGVQIDNIAFVSLGALLPAGKAVQYLASQGLKGLSISQHEPVNVTDDALAAFNKLEYLKVELVEITGLGAKAFVPLVNLQSLYLSQVGLTGIPPALDPATGNAPLNLTSLGLEGNNLTSLPSGILGAYSNLHTLILSGNPIADYVKSGGLSGLGPSLQKLVLTDVGLTSVPTRLFDTGGVTTLDLSYNNITTLLAQDFSSANQVQLLILDGNHLKTVEAQAFPDSQHYRLNQVSLKENDVGEIDLTVFTDIGPSLTEVNLEDNILQSVFASKTPLPPPTRLSINMKKSSIKVLDYSVEHLLNSSSEVQIDISDCYSLVCEGLDWIAPYVLNSHQVKASNTFCADQGDVPLETYLTRADQPTTKAATTAEWSNTTAAAATTTAAPPATTKGAHKINSSIMWVLTTVLGVFVKATL